MKARREVAPAHRGSTHGTHGHINCCCGDILLLCDASLSPLQWAGFRLPAFAPVALARKFCVVQFRVVDRQHNGAHFVCLMSGADCMFC